MDIQNQGRVLFEPYDFFVHLCPGAIAAYALFTMGHLFRTHVEHLPLFRNDLLNLSLFLITAYVLGNVVDVVSSWLRHGVCDPLLWRMQGRSCSNSPLRALAVTAQLGVSAEQLPREDEDLSQLILQRIGESAPILQRELSRLRTRSAFALNTAYALLLLTVGLCAHAIADGHWSVFATSLLALVLVWLSSLWLERRFHAALVSAYYFCEHRKSLFPVDAAMAQTGNR